jgi:hypothetical protein
MYFSKYSFERSPLINCINKVKQIDRWSRTPKSIQDRLALEAAKKGAGERIMQGTPLFSKYSFERSPLIN